MDVPRRLCCAARWLRVRQQSGVCPHHDTRCGRGVARRKWNSCAQPCDEVADGGGGFGGVGLFDERDDGAADDGGIGELADGADVRGVRDAEADGDGQLGELAQAGDEVGGVGGDVVSGCR